MTAHDWYVVTGTVGAVVMWSWLDVGDGESWRAGDWVSGILVEFYRTL